MEPPALKQYLTLIAVFTCGLIVRSQIVDIPELGQLQGSITYGARTGREIYQFLGVKFAESPSQQNRFKPPIPVQPWDGIKNVTVLGRMCPNINLLLALPPAEWFQDHEDCLHMSIYSNNLNPEQPVPVMVYIHGGSFAIGSAESYPPNYLVERDVVLVVPQYRLGPLGFLSTMSDDIPGDVAALDVILALEFIQKHIHLFGGDASRVTIFGQSAGAAMVSALTLSPMVPTHLYHKAILQSGSVISSWTIDTTPVETARDIATRSGCDGTTSIDELNQCLLNLDVLSLLWGFTEHWLIGSLSGAQYYGGNKFVVGGPSNFFPISPYEIMLNGLGRPNLPMMAGATKHDGTFILTTYYDIINLLVGINNTRLNSFKMIDMMNRLSGIEDLTGSLHGYMTQTLFTHEQLMEGSFLDMMPGWFDQSAVTIMKGPTIRAAQANSFLNPYHTYMYTFDYQGQFSRFGYGADVSGYPFQGGIAHSDDNLYLFPFPPFAANLNEADTRMSEIMVDLWTSFATTGRPYSDMYPLWPPMTDVTGPYIHIDNDGRIGEDYLDEFSVTVREGLPYCEDCILEWPGHPQRNHYKLLYETQKLIYNNESDSLSNYV